MLDLPVFIIRSKLCAPPVAPDAITRSRLLDLAPAVASSTATLVSAPAGYGKSTLVSHWLGAIGGNTAWLSLDSADGDMRQFLSYVVAALRSTFPHCCSETVQTLQVPRLPPAEVMAGIFCNDFDDLDASVVLALDDYYQISSAEVHDFLDAVLRRPPLGLHIVIITRHDPPLSLQKLRASGALTEVRMQHLAFSKEEARDFVRRKLGDRIDDHAIATLHERTEGWPAGLRLATLAAPADRAAGDFVERIPEDIHTIRAYLLHEVLAKCSLEERRYLLRTAFLDRFCAALCDAVCGIEDGESRSISGGEFIRRINDTAFFSIPLDSKQRWFRYHHLFQAMLKEQAVADLGEDEIRAVHRRASHWFESEGLLEEAIKHALEADGAPAAAAMIIRQRHTIMNNEEWHRLDAWLRLLPEELLASRPELLLLKARQLRTAGSREEVDHYLERAESLLDITDLDDGTRRELRGSIESTRCYQLYTMSDGPAAAAAARKALELLPTESLAERGFASIILGGALQMTGEFSEGRRVLYASMSDPSAGGAQSPTLKTRLLVGLAFIHWMHGDLNALKPLVEETVALAEQMDLREVLTVAKTFEAAIYYQRNELTTVHDVLRDLLHRRAIANAEFHVQCMISLALAHQALGNSKAASQVADALQTTALRAQNVFLIGVADAFAAELALRQGRMAEARKWAAQYDPEPLTPMYSPLSPALVLAKILVLDTSEDGRERAGAVLEQLVDYLTRTHNNRFLAEALALRAMLRDMEGLSQAAAEDLTTAIALAQPGRFIRLFVDLGPRLGNLLSRLELDDERLLYAGEILAAFRQPTAQTDAYVASAPTGTPTLALDPLSDREQQILGLLAERLSNKEIADRLHVSTVTVKRHAANIYQKLGVHSRRQAVAKASGLGMITRTK